MAKKKLNKLLTNILGAGAFGLSLFFGWLILQGTIALFPQITGVTMITIGVVGLAVIGFFGYKNFK